MPSSVIFHSFPLVPDSNAPVSLSSSRPKPKRMASPPMRSRSSRRNPEPSRL